MNWGGRYYGLRFKNTYCAYREPSFFPSPYTYMVSPESGTEDLMTSLLCGTRHAHGTHMDTQVKH